MLFNVNWCVFMLHICQTPINYSKVYWLYWAYIHYTHY